MSFNSAFFGVDRYGIYDVLTQKFGANPSASGENVNPLLFSCLRDVRSVFFFGFLFSPSLLTRGKLFDCTHGKSNPSFGFRFVLFKNKLSGFRLLAFPS